MNVFAEGGAHLNFTPTLQTPVHDDCLNPVAGRRRAHLLWRILDVLVANGVRLDLAETHRAGHAEALAREAARRGEKLVVAAGGEMLGVGFDVNVVRNISFPLKKVLGKGAYVLQSAREMIRYKLPPIRLCMDDMDTEAATVIISKGRLYGGSYRLVPNAAPGDSGFSVVLFERSGPAAAEMYGAALPLNLMCRAPGVRYIRACRVDIMQSQCVPVQTDGDGAGYAPLWVEDAPAPIQIVVA